MHETTNETTESARIWDVIIIGGGAAGLSAGLVLARARFATLIVDGGSPRNRPAEAMHGYLTRDGMSPRQFIAAGRAEFTGYGGTIAHASALDARRADGRFEIGLDDRTVRRARAVLVATGLTDELPDIPGLSERWAVDVHHCPHCHGHEARDGTIAVIGSPMTAVSIHLAALMRRYSASVTFCVNGIDVDEAERGRLTTHGVRLVDGHVHKLTPAGDCASGERTAIHLDSGETVVCDAIFLAPRPIPHDSILIALGARTDPSTGFVAVDSQGATDIPGLWAAGNVVDPRAQVVTAASAGSVAAINMTGWLLHQDLTTEGEIR